MLDDELGGEGVYRKVLNCKGLYLSGWEAT